MKRSGQRDAPNVPSFSTSVRRLVGVACPQVQTAIVSQMKAMGSYKVSSSPGGDWVHFGGCREPRVFVFFTQLGPVTPTSVQANHTSAVGQVEAVNFTIIPTTMAAGCHVQVRRTHAGQVLVLTVGGLSGPPL